MAPPLPWGPKRGGGDAALMRFGLLFQRRTLLGSRVERPSGKFIIPLGVLWAPHLLARATNTFGRHYPWPKGYPWDPMGTPCCPRGTHGIPKQWPMRAPLESREGSSCPVVRVAPLALLKPQSMSRCFPVCKPDQDGINLLSENAAPRQRSLRCCSILLNSAVWLRLQGAT